MTKFFAINAHIDKRPYVFGTGVSFAALETHPPCEVCRRTVPGRSIGDPTVSLDNSGKAWPDALGCIGNLFVSERVLDDWRTDGVGEFPHRPAILESPFPKRLKDVEPPHYFWLNRAEMDGAQFDFEASGWVGVAFCPGCGQRTYDVAATGRRQHERVWPYALVDGSWNGANVFSVAGAGFLCTEEVLECARRRRHTNFRFTPAEVGQALWSDGIDYLGKKWPVHHPLRPSEGKSIDEWIGELESPDPMTRWEARRAIVDLREEAASGTDRLTELLDHQDQSVQGEAMVILSFLKKLGVPLNPKAAAAAELHEKQFQATLGPPRKA